MDVTIIQNMSATEAEIALTEMEAHLITASDLAHEFDLRLGWKALGYDDLRACLIDRFNRHGYRLVKLMEVRANLALSPVGQNGDELRERHVRDSGIAELCAGEQVEAFTIARQLAGAEQAVMTTEHVTKAVAQVQTRHTVFQSSYVVLTHMVVAGNITAVVGHELVQAMDKLKPKSRGHILQLMGKFGLCCPALLAPIAGMFDRQPGQESFVLPEVLRGYLGGAPLAEATLTDMENANEEARHEHMAKNFEDSLKDGVKAEIITVYKGDPKRTLAALRTALGDEVYALRDLLMED